MGFPCSLLMGTSILDSHKKNSADKAYLWMDQSFLGLIHQYYGDPPLDLFSEDRPLGFFSIEHPLLDPVTHLRKDPHWEGPGEELHEDFHED